MISMNEVKMNLSTLTLPGFTILNDTIDVLEKWIASDANVVVLGGHTALKAYLQQLITQSLSMFCTRVSATKAIMIAYVQNLRL